MINIKTTLNVTLSNRTKCSRSALSVQQSLYSESKTIQSRQNDTMSQFDRQANKAEIESEIHGVVDALNTNFGDVYICGINN